MRRERDMLAVFVIDCGEHTLLRRLAAAGRMPVLGSLLDRGAAVPLASDAHVLDGSVFQTLLTGANPGEHGIYKYRQLVPGTYRTEKCLAKHSPVPQVWTVLSGLGRRCCVFDVPKAFPVAGFNGLLVGSWGSYSPAAESGSVPEGLLRDVLGRFGPHPQRMHRPLPLPVRRYERILGRLVAAAALRAEIIRWLLERGPFDLLMTAFSESHVASHQFWQLRDTRHPAHDPAAAAACGDAMERVYCAIDGAIGRVLDALPRDATVVVLTQQGVTNNFSGSHLLPDWLARRGGALRSPASRSRLVRAAAALGAPLRAALSRHLPDRLLDLWLARKYRPDGDVFLLPGWEYMAFLRVNLAGREPAGTVPQDRYGATLAALRDDLLALRNPDTGEPAVAEVVSTRERYRGQRLDDLPDVVVRWRNDAPIRALDCPRLGRLVSGLESTNMAHSCHTGEGLAVVAGPGIPARELATRHAIQDLTATFYRLLGEPVPGHVEGSPIGLGQAGDLSSRERPPPSAACSGS